MSQTPMPAALFAELHALAQAKATPTPEQERYVIVVLSMVLGRDTQWLHLFLNLEKFSIRLLLAMR